MFELLKAIDKDAVTMATAVFGAVTGFAGLMISLYNAKLQRDRMRARLRLATKQTILGGLTHPNYPRGVRITVANLSEFAVELVDVGFVLERGEQFGLAEHYRLDGYQNLPAELPAKMSFHRDVNRLSRGLAPESIRGIYAVTACGARARNCSRSVRRMVSQVKTLKKVEAGPPVVGSSGHDAASGRR